MGEAKKKKLAEITALIKKALELKLTDAEWVACFSSEELAPVYNGIGPEWLPSSIREKLTEYLAIFAPACLIHDFRFRIGNGSYLDFASANNALEENLYKCVNAEIKWYHPLRRLAGYYAAHLMAEACRRYGWSAYRAGRMEDGEGRSDGVRSDGVRSQESESTPNPSKLSLCLSASVLIFLTGCYRSIELVREGEYTLSYTAVGLKTDVDTIEAEKTTNGVRVLIKGVATDVSERNAKIIESSGTAVGNVAKEVMGGVK
jgi:hypothetical protein